MKEYIKPEVELIEFESEKITVDFEGGSDICPSGTFDDDGWV